MPRKPKAPPPSPRRGRPRDDRFSPEAVFLREYASKADRAALARMPDPQERAAFVDRGLAAGGIRSARDRTARGLKDLVLGVFATEFPAAADLPRKIRIEIGYILDKETGGTGFAVPAVPPPLTAVAIATAQRLLAAGYRSDAVAAILRRRHRAHLRGDPFEAAVHDLQLSALEYVGRPEVAEALLETGESIGETTARELMRRLLEEALLSSGDITAADDADDALSL